MSSEKTKGSRTYPIYFADSGDGFFFMSQGLAKDHSRALRNSDAISETFLHVRGDQLPILSQPRTVTIYSGVVDRGGPQQSPFYLTEWQVDCWVAEHCGDAYVNKYRKITCRLSTERPVAPKEVFVMFSRDPAGRLFTTIVSNPDVTGWSGSQKRFFPDRSWKGAREGGALVKIVYEKETYGFVVGEMVEERSPCLKSVLEYLWANAPLLDNLLVYKGENGLLGYAWEQQDLTLHRLFTYAGQSEVRCKRMTAQQAQWAVTHRISLHSVLIEQAKDIYGLTVGDTYNLLQVKESKQLDSFLGAKRPRADVQFIPGFGGCGAPSKVVAACEAGAFIPWWVGGYRDLQGFVVDLERFHTLLDLSITDLRAVLKYVSVHNAQVDDAINSRVESGQLHLLPAVG